MTNKNILVLGSVNQDHTVQAPRLPKPGETIMGHRHILAYGGKGANQAVAAARLGASVNFIACMGDDSFGREALIKFAEDGIHTQDITLCRDQNTGIALILVDDNGGNCIAISPNANNELSTDLIEQKSSSIKNADYLLVQLETPLEGVKLAIDIAKDNDTYVVLNPAPARALEDDLLAKLDLITPNETEAELLTGIKVIDEVTATKACEYFISKGVKTVIITMGSRGAFLYQNGKGTLIPGFKVNATDTTAAGDTFNGALLVGLSQGMEMSDAIILAHKASAISVTRMGAQTSIPYLHELNLI